MFFFFLSLLHQDRACWQSRSIVFKFAGMQGTAQKHNLLLDWIATCSKAPEMLVSSIHEHPRCSNQASDGKIKEKKSTFAQPLCHILKTQSCKCVLYPLRILSKAAHTPSLRELPWKLTRLYRGIKPDRHLPALYISCSSSVTLVHGWPLNETVKSLLSVLLPAALDPQQHNPDCQHREQKTRGLQETGQQCCLSDMVTGIQVLQSSRQNISYRNSKSKSQDLPSTSRELHLFNRLSHKQQLPTTSTFQ